MHQFADGNDASQPLTSGWLTMRKDEMELLASNRAQFVFLASIDDELVRVWYVLYTTEFHFFSAQQKDGNDMKSPTMTLPISDLANSRPAKGRGYYENIIHLETRGDDKREADTIHVQVHPPKPYPAPAPAP